MGDLLRLAAHHPPDARESREALDTRFTPSFVDLGKIQLCAYNLATEARAAGQAPFSKDYTSKVTTMIHRYVRGVVSVGFAPDTGLLHFTAEDEWGRYHYSFTVQRSWFRKLTD